MASTSMGSSSGGQGGPSKRKREITRYPAFRTAISKLFKRWSALNIAIDQGQGDGKGKEIAAWMETVLDDFFYTNDDLMGDEVEEFLGEIMNRELHTIVEDNSLREMGELLCQYFRMCKDNKEAELLEILKNLDMSAPKTVQSMAPTAMEDSSESESD